MSPVRSHADGLDYGAVLVPGERGLAAHLVPYDGGGLLSPYGGRHQVHGSRIIAFGKYPSALLPKTDASALVGPACPDYPSPAAGGPLACP